MKLLLVAVTSLLVQQSSNEPRPQPPKLIGVEIKQTIHTPVCGPPITLLEYGILIIPPKCGGLVIDEIPRARII